MSLGFHQLKAQLSNWLTAPFDGEAFLKTCQARFASAKIRALQVAAQFQRRTTPPQSAADTPIAPAKSRNLRILELVLWCSAALSIIYCAGFYASAAVFQSREKSRFAAALRSADPALQPTSTAATLPTENPDTPAASTDPLLGTLTIARMDILSIVEEGIDSESLALSVGHMPGSALPGQRGNMILAAHRDTYFTRLGEMEPGDEIVFRSPNREYKYLVDATQIVDEHDTSVLADTPGTTLTLITCYPFHYVGAAPKRFVVTAHIATP